jgi:hypothetical protein
LTGTSSWRPAQSDARLIEADDEIDWSKRGAVSPPTAWRAAGRSTLPVPDGLQNLGDRLLDGDGLTVHRIRGEHLADAATGLKSYRIEKCFL